jgi:hypothetical protein
MIGARLKLIASVVSEGVAPKIWTRDASNTCSAATRYAAQPLHHKILCYFIHRLPISSTGLVETRWISFDKTKYIVPIKSTSLSIARRLPNAVVKTAQAAS